MGGCACVCVCFRQPRPPTKCMSITFWGHPWDDRARGSCSRFSALSLSLSLSLSCVQHESCLRIYCMCCSSSYWVNRGQSMVMMMIEVWITTCGNISVSVLKRRRCSMHWRWSFFVDRNCIEYANPLCFELRVK